MPDKPTEPKTTPPEPFQLAGPPPTPTGEARLSAAGFRLVRGAWRRP